MTSRFFSGLEKARPADRRLIGVIVLMLAAYAALWAAGVFPEPEPATQSAPVVAAAGGAAEADAYAVGFAPPIVAVLPFAALLLSIALLPLLQRTAEWWGHTRNQFFLAAALSAATLLYYGTMHPGGLENHFTHQGAASPGWETVTAALSNALLSEYVPFIVLLLGLYVASGGVFLAGNLAAHPGANAAFLGVGAVLASIIGTTGAAMVLIRPLLRANQERSHKTHTVVFFIFVVCNCGGLLLPTGDPPLFLGYLRGVPFTWTLGLWPYWLGVNLALIGIYFLWERRLYRQEPPEAIRRDEAQATPLRLEGGLNLVWMLAIVAAVAVVVPGEPLPGTSIVVPPFLREAVLLLLTLLSLTVSDPGARARNRFNYHAIAEVAALFSGIFICMQVPVEILNARGAALGVSSPMSFFWATGTLSSFLDNAPTYVVFLELGAASLPAQAVDAISLSGSRAISEAHLTAVSLGAVFMGAMTYVGNGPNFMVRSIAHHAGVPMPGFFRYMLFSGLVLLPIFAVVAFALRS